MKTNIKLLRVLIVSVVFILQINTIITAQVKFILSDKNIEEYKLISQVNTFWPISTDSLKSNVTEQKWIKSESEEYYISYCEFESEEDATKSMAYTANSCAMPFIFGSPTGEIIGDASWVALDGSAVCFQIGNIGIKIFKPINFKLEDRNNILRISNKVLERIRDGILSEIKMKEEELLKYQLSITDYQKITNETDVILIREGYTEYKTENSKWLISENNQIRGYRKQWSKDQSIFSIDIAKFSDSTVAQNATEFRGKISYSPVCILNYDESASEAINKWLKTWKDQNTLRYISIVGRIDNKSIHFYYYDNDGIDADKIYEIMKAII